MDDLTDTIVHRVPHARGTSEVSLPFAHIDKTV